MDARVCLMGGDAIIDSPLRKAIPGPRAEARFDSFWQNACPCLSDFLRPTRLLESVDYGPRFGGAGVADNSANPTI